MERAVAHLVERHGGAFPAWLAPVQLVVLPVSVAEESQARALVAVPAEREQELAGLAAEHGVPALRLGTTGGTALDLEGVGSFEAAELRELREGTLPRHFG